MSGPNATVWQPNLQEGEFTQGTAQGLVDSFGVQLIDGAGTSLYDNGTTYTPVAQTTWSSNDTA